MLVRTELPENASVLQSGYKLPRHNLKIFMRAITLGGALFSVALVRQHPGYLAPGYHFVGNYSADSGM